MSASQIPQALWDLQVPLFITHMSAPNTPFVTAVPRFSYLALLLPRLSAYFGLPCSSFHHEDVLLRNLAVGLLCDLYQPTLPWRLVVGDGVSWDIRDTFLNSAKEADFVRNGNAQQIMSLSKENTNGLWDAVKDSKTQASPSACAWIGSELIDRISDNYTSFNKVNSRLLNTSRDLKNVPIRLYIPTPQSDGDNNNPAGAFKVVQSLVQPRVNDRTPQTIGAALRKLLPQLFPSSRDPVLAAAILHGARVPFGAPLEELMREAAYPDGWLCLVVVPLEI
ncbi:autophagy protein Apg5-domain-containing protein [Xylariaceae sp. FL1272]|nr:autophagy protein Apg5-domain-containing protein [Xylariaceae sp. FL1272]